jgi:Tol biopolymer transport system component
VSLPSGSRLGDFEVIDLLGSGGMGEVYRALDPRLGREVAVKVLPESVAGSEAHLARFDREARFLASLSHPNIASIFGLEESEGRRLLIMELVPGETLAERLGRGPMPVGETLAVAAQIAAALEAAHARSIVHRDLKPLNIKIRPDGMVKVLDFGLARALAVDDGQDGAGPLAITRTLDRTALGVILGTPEYMSPEQARGQAVDGGTDLWSFGCIVVEMLTGRSPFAAPTLTDTLVAIVTREADLGALPGETPPSLREALASCLRKEREQRTIDASGVLALLDRAMEESGLATPAAGGWRGAGRGAAAEEPRRPARLRQITFTEEIDGFPAWSPDGTEIVFARETGGVRSLFRMKTDGGEETRLTRGPFDDIMPAWSPDGRMILFVRARAKRRKLEPGDVFAEYEETDIWSLDLDTGRESRLIERAASPAYAADGRTIAFDARWAGPRRIWIADPLGRNPRQATTDTSEAIVHLRPRWSPDGSRLVFQNVERTKFDLRVVDPGTRELSFVTNDPYQDLNPVWSPSGRYIYFSSYRSGGLNIWRIPVRPDGTPTGAPEQVTAGAGQDVEIALSPAGTRLAFTILRQNAGIWRLPVDPATGRPTGEAERVISGSREESRGAWSPDGRAIAFNSDRGGTMNIWLRPADGSPMRQLTRGEGGDYQPAWSPDGTTLAFFSSRGGSPGIWTVEIESGSSRRLSQGSAMEINPFYAPDGGSIAYQSDRGGRLELWVMAADGSGARQLTHTGVGGHFMRWTRAGDAIIYRANSGAGPGGGPGVMRIAATGGEPETLGDIAGGAHISLSPDQTKIMDVVAHKTLWVSTIGGGPPERVFEFDDPDARIDYPLWSPDGQWILFDRFRPQGGDIWVMDGAE